MGGQDDVRTVKERVVFWKSLLDLEHVQGGPSEFSGLQGVRECRLVDDATTRTVDDAGGWLHHRQFLGIQKVLGGRNQGDVQGEKVHLFQEVFQREELHVHRSRTCFVDVRIVSDQPHADLAGHFGNVTADLTQAHNPQNFPIQLTAHEGSTLPLVTSDRRVSSRDETRRGEHHGKSVLCSSNGVSRGRVDNKDTALGCGLNVNVIHTHTCASDNLQLLACLNDLCSHSRGRSDHHCVVVPNHLNQSIFGLLGLHIDFSDRLQNVDTRLVYGICNKHLVLVRTARCHARHAHWSSEDEVQPP
mmetsp:Transcript_3118/g.6414  ORF Transcript_3118/g.6414 Transcript_3118/m.6414 type:complete len:302 (-) Transcript_3118:131-1036(-)